MSEDLEFWEHLEDLRKRIILSILFFFFAGGIIYPFSGRIIKLITGFVGKTYFFAPQEALFIRIKISLILGLVVALPFIIHQIYIFIIPALTHEERKYTTPMLLAIIIFFYSGAAVAYFFFVPYIINMLLSFQMAILQPLISISKYFSFLMWVIAGFGISFEMPVFIFLLTKLGIITPSMLIENWKIALISILGFAAVITPTVDVVTMLITSIPLTFLYLFSIGASLLAGRSKK